MIATIVCNLYRNTAVQWLTLTLPLEALHHECFIRKPSLLRAFDELSRNEGVWQATYPYSGNQGYIRNLGVPIYRFTQHCVNNWRYGNPLYHSTMLQVVSASDVTPTDRWLNVWCIWHTKVETLQEFRSRHRIGWIINYDFRETCVSLSLPFRLETKLPWHQTPSRKKKAIVFTTDDERMSGSTKHWIFKSMWNI